MNTTVGGAKREEVGLYSMQLVGGDRKLLVEGDVVEKIGGNFTNESSLCTAQKIHASSV